MSFNVMISTGEFQLNVHFPSCLGPRVCFTIYKHTNTFVCQFLQKSVRRWRSPLSGVDLQNVLSRLPLKKKKKVVVLQCSVISVFLELLLLFFSRKKNKFWLLQFPDFFKCDLIFTKGTNINKHNKADKTLSWFFMYLLNTHKHTGRW